MKKQWWQYLGTVAMVCGITGIIFGVMDYPFAGLLTGIAGISAVIYFFNQQKNS